MRSERHGTGLVLVPAAATLLGVSVAWAGAHDPMAQQPASAPDAAAVTASAPVTPGTSAAPVEVVDPQFAALAAQIEAAQARVAQLQVTLTAQATQAAQSAAAPAPAKAPAPAPAPAKAPARAAAPAPAPRVHATTGASG